jgi:glutamate-1-semialdehyde 2,1-aminomutase
MSPKDAAHYERACRSIPWGTQTHAKRPERDGMTSRPAFIQRARGCRLWDLDGREYIDYRAALGPIVLGYQDPEVDAAVRRQMEDGVLLSMASPIEAGTAESILGTVRWPERIRFMKTGADATACCLRLARSHTGRTHFLTCGYHGYQDWFALAWPKPGIPEALLPFVHEVRYGDREAVDRVFAEHGPDLAAAIVVPIEWHLPPDRDFLVDLRRRCDVEGAALVFDEILTGFRLARGGAAEYFGIEPDLAAYAKGIANGYPLSAYAGKREWMDTLEQTIITTTYAGETLSLAAARAVMEIYQREPVQAHLFRLGAQLRAGFDQIIRETGLPAFTVGVDPGVVLDFSPAGEEADALHVRLFNYLYEHGIFANEQWFITYAHQPADIEQTLDIVRQGVRATL